MMSVAADKDGVSRAVLCSLVLGKMEIVSPNSGQCGPRSDEFDSGAEDLVSPNKYFMWSENASTRILPLDVLCFRPSGKVTGRCRSSLSGRTKPGVGSLIKDISKFVPADAMKTIGKHYLEYKKLKRPDMIRLLRCIVGDELVNRFIKPHMEKGNKHKPVEQKKYKYKPVEQKKDMEVVEGLMGQFSRAFNI